VTGDAGRRRWLELLDEAVAAREGWEWTWPGGALPEPTPEVIASG